MTMIDKSPADGTLQIGNDELASVLIAPEADERGQEAWYQVLRPWLFCLAFLIIAEIGARLYFDNTLCLEPERLDNYPNAAIENAFLAQMRRDTAYKVVIIGDSTVVGASLLDKRETVPQLLEAELNRMARGRRIHVWNMSIQGARATDDLCLLESVLNAEPSFVIIEANYFISDAELFRQPLMNPWLAYNLPRIPVSLQPLVPKRDWKQKWEYQLTTAIEDHIRFVGLRQAINAKVFGVQPRRQPFDTANPAVMEAVAIAKRLHKLKPQNWIESGLNIRDSGWLYHYAIRPIGPDNINGQFYREAIADLENHHINAMTYLTPQNPAITDWVMSPQWYADNRHVLAGFLSGDGIPCIDYCDLIPERLFVDNDHMLPEGNRQLAHQLALSIAPRIVADLH